MQSLIVLASFVFELAGRVKISGCPSSEITASLKKKYIDPRWKGYQLCEFRLIWKTWKFDYFLAHFLWSSTQKNNSYRQ